MMKRNKQTMTKLTPLLIGLLCGLLLGGFVAALALLQWIIFVTREPFRREHYSYMDLEYGAADALPSPTDTYTATTRYSGIDFTWVWPPQ